MNQTMNGTEWTEPGQGATWDEFEFAIRDMPPSQDRHASLVYNILAANVQGGQHRANLRLTGAPLTAYDVRRIGEAK